MKIKNSRGQLTVGCQYSQSIKGVDAEPYVSSIFKCDTGAYLTLKQVKGSNASMLIAIDESGALMTQDCVSIRKKAY
ncbi:TPA: hypothetical protein RVC36_004691 [Escherichia coli]|nr:hypothetical protein [Escherichia coli]